VHDRPNGPTMTESSVTSQPKDPDNSGWRQWFRSSRLGLLLIGGGVITGLGATMWWFSMSVSCLRSFAATPLDARYPLLVGASALAVGWGLVLCLRGRPQRWLAINVGIVTPIVVLIVFSQSQLISRIHC
jgi:hypothetical protein